MSPKPNGQLTVRHFRTWLPSDEYDPATWTMQCAVSELKLLFRVGKRLAFEEKWPRWKEGSEFKAIREKQQ